MSEAITPAEAAAIQVGIRVAQDLVATATAVVRMRRETVEFLERADTLRDLVYLDIEAVARTVHPMLDLLLQSEEMGTEERLALIATVRALAEISARGRAAAISQLAKKV